MAKRKPFPVQSLSLDLGKLYEVLNKERTDLPVVLITASYLDECLASLLQSFMISGDTANSLLAVSGAIGSFAVRADLAYSLGLINKFAFDDIKKIGQIRNAFAHSHLEVNFSVPNVQNLTNELSYLAVLDKEMSMNNTSVGDPPPTFSEFATSPRDRFVHTAVMLAQHLLLWGLGVKRRDRCNDFVQSQSESPKSAISVFEIKQQIKSLLPEQILEIRAFLDELEAQAFDTQLETDSASGKFDSLISKLETKIGD
jgi:DNA-binding MltR family transcriptional regulator